MDTSIWRDQCAMLEKYGKDDPINIFYLDHAPAAAAQAHCDRHVVKMILETAQLLSTAWHVLAPGAVQTDYVYTDPLFPYTQETLSLMAPGLLYYLGNQRIYAKTHEHHPSAAWARECDGNYTWLWTLGMELCEEYTHRYKKTHKTLHVLRTLEFPPAMPSGAWTEPPPAMPEELILTTDGYVDAVASYRNYYCEAKRALLRYTRRAPPEWCAQFATAVAAPGA